MQPARTALSAIPARFSRSSDTSISRTGGRQRIPCMEVGRPGGWTAAQAVPLAGLTRDARRTSRAKLVRRTVACATLMTTNGGPVREDDAFASWLDVSRLANLQSMQRCQITGKRVGIHTTVPCPQATALTCCRRFTVSTHRRYRCIKRAFAAGSTTAVASSRSDSTYSGPLTLRPTAVTLLRHRPTK